MFSRQVFILLRDLGPSFEGAAKLPCGSSGNQRKLPLCSKGTNFGSRFSYSWYCSTTRDVRTHKLAPSCPSSSPPPLNPVGTPIPSLQHTRGQYNPSLSLCPTITGDGFHTVRISWPPWSSPECTIESSREQSSHGMHSSHKGHLNLPATSLTHQGHGPMPFSPELAASFV